MHVYQSEVLKRKKEKKNSEYRTLQHVMQIYVGVIVVEINSLFLNESYFQEETCVENYVLTTNCMS